MKVRVIKEGFMFGSMQKVGTELTLKKEAHFSKNWMEKIEPAKKDKSEKKTEKKEPEKKAEQPED